MSRNLMEVHSALRILDATKDAVISINLKGIIELANPAVKQVFGYDPEDIIGESVQILMPKEHASQHHIYIQRYMESRDKRVMDTNREIECVHKDGSTFFADLTILEYDLDGQLYFTGVVRDITDLKRREQELEKKNRELTQSNELLQRFAYISAHDLKTPLRSMTGMVNDFVRVIQKYVDDGKEPNIERLRRAAKLISSDTEKMSSTIDDTLRYCKAGQDLDSDWVSLDSIINSALDSARALIDENNVMVDKEKARIKLHCDASQMTQVFYNLITNAVKYNDSECKRVWIEAYTQGENVMIHVRDNGRGIPEDQQHKVFELFQKLQNEGSGVGGAIVNRIVRGHGGNITIDSVVGEGTTFNIKLPIKDI